MVVFGVRSLADDLVVPEAGPDRLRHDATFRSWDATFSSYRDVANHGIRLLNHVGAGLPTLPEGSLEELLVAPLTGDYGRIRRNGDACLRVASAFATWGHNLGALGLGMDPRWDGRAAVAFLARMEAADVVARGVGQVVAAGARVLEEIALASETVGVEVERVVVALGKLLRRVALRILEKVGGPVGWAAFGAELATRGLDAVTGIVEDVELVIELVARARDLRDAVADWAECQRQRLEVLAGLPELLASGSPGALASALEAGGGTGLDRDLGEVHRLAGTASNRS